jgi:hypothetical protein
MRKRDIVLISVRRASRDRRVNLPDLPVGKLTMQLRAL